MRSRGPSGNRGDGPGRIYLDQPRRFLPGADVRGRDACLRAGREMTRYLAGGTATIEDCWEVAATNRCLALRNPSAAHAQTMTASDVEASALVADPLRELDCPRTADGAVVVVLAAEPRARSLCPLPVWVDGIGWSTESPSLSTRTWGKAEYARPAAEQAYAQAGITDPGAAIGL